MTKHKRTRRSRAAGAALNVATVATGAALGHVGIKVIAPKAVHIVADAATEFGLDKVFEKGFEVVADAVKDKE
jgi:hypothetical protein